MTACVLATGLLIGFAPQRASASDLVVRDSYVAEVLVLDDALVYARARPDGRTLKRPWMRVVRGRAVRARGMPDRASAGSVGRDRAGRAVLTVGVRKRDGTSRRWWIYDVATDRARRLRGVRREGCATYAVAVWRRRLAFTARCGDRSAVFESQRGQARRLTRWGTEYQEWTDLVVGRRALIAVSEQYDGETSLWRLSTAGRRCRTMIGGSYTADEWQRLGPWLSGSTLTWWAADWLGDQSPGILLARRLRRTCGRPSATGVFRLTPPPPRSSVSLTVAGRRLYYVDRQGIHRQRLPKRPRTAPPPNDDFEYAAPLIGDPPIAASATIGNATRQAVEPTTGAARTTWYSFRPATTQSVEIGPWVPILNIYTGSQLRMLREVPSDIANDSSFLVDVVAGRVYWIQAGCDIGDPPYGFECYVPFTLQITPVALPP